MDHILSDLSTMTCLSTWFFSSCGGILDLRRGSQPSPGVGPGKPNLPLGLRGKAGGCARVTAYNLKVCASNSSSTLPGHRPAEPQPPRLQRKLHTLVGRVAFTLTPLVPFQCWLLCCGRLFVTPWTVAHQDPLCMDFSRQEHWSGCKEAWLLGPKGRRERS